MGVKMAHLDPLRQTPTTLTKGGGQDGYMEGLLVSVGVKIQNGVASAGPVRLSFVS